MNPILGPKRTLHTKATLCHLVPQVIQFFQVTKPSFPVCLHPLCIQCFLPFFHLGPHYPWLSSTPRVGQAYLGSDSSCGPFCVSSPNQKVGVPNQRTQFYTSYDWKRQTNFWLLPCQTLFLLLPTYLGTGFSRTHSDRDVTFGPVLWS